MQKGAATHVDSWKREVAMFVAQISSCRNFLDDDYGEPQQPPLWTMEEEIKVEVAEDDDGDEPEEKQTSTPSPSKKTKAKTVKTRVRREPTVEEASKFKGAYKATYLRHKRAVALYVADREMWLDNQAALRGIVYQACKGNAKAERVCVQKVTASELSGAAGSATIARLVE